MKAIDLPVRIVSDEVFRPDEYNLGIIFTGWETESGTAEDTSGWDLVVVDDYHKVEVNIRFNAHGGVLTTEVVPASGEPLP